MADFNFAQFAAEWEAKRKRKLTHVDAPSESLRSSYINISSHYGQEYGAGSSNPNQDKDIREIMLSAVRVELARQQAAAQLQLQTTQFGGSLLAVGHQMGYATPQASATANCGTYVPVAGPSRGDQGHDPMTASASGCVDQGHGSTEAASGTRPKTRSQTPAAKAVVEVDNIRLLAVTLAEAMKANQPRGQSRDQSCRRGQVSYGSERSTGGTSVRSDSRKGGRERSQSRGRDLVTSRNSNRDPTYSASRRGQVSDGSYTSRERSTGGTSVRSDSRNRGRERSQPRGHDLVASRTSNRDPTDSASRYQSYRRAESRSPRRSSDHQSRTSEDRTGRSASRGRSKDSSRPNSGFLRQNYPEMECGTNCRMGYNPVKEKHCTKCYPTAEHHEFLCKRYALYNYGTCTLCGRGHHFHVECKDRVETFPQNVGESHSGGLGKKLVFAPERSKSFAGVSFPTTRWSAVVQNSSLSEQEKEILERINSQRKAESSAHRKSSGKTISVNSASTESSEKVASNCFSKANCADSGESETAVPTADSISASETVTFADSTEKDDKMVPNACHQSSDTAETTIASNSSLSSQASTSRLRMLVPRPAGALTPCDKVSESFIEELQHGWMDQIKQSHCSESSKSRDLEIIKSLAGSLDLIGDCIPERILEISQASDSHLGKIWDSLRGTANAGNEFPYFLMKNGILYRKYMQDPGKEKHVICLPDELLPAVIHLLHVNHAHSTYVETRGIFRHHYHHRNAGRIMRSYIKACTLCTKKPA